MDYVQLHLTYAQHVFEAQPKTEIIEIELPRVPVPHDNIILRGKGGLPTCFWVSDVYFHAAGGKKKFVATCFLYEGGHKSSHSSLLGETGGGAGWGTPDLFPAGREDRSTVSDLISHLACYPSDMKVYTSADEGKSTGLGLSVHGDDLFISVELEDG